VTRIQAVIGIVALVAVATACKKDEKPADKPPQPAANKPTEPVKPPDADKPPMKTASMFVKHDVADYDKWKAAFDKHLDARKAIGVMWHSVSRHVDNDKTAILHFVGTDLAKMQAFAGSDDLKKVMKEAGVTGPPEIWFANDVEIKSPEGKLPDGTVSVIVKHEVEDYDKWKAAFDKHEAARKEGSAVGHSVSRDADNPNIVYVHAMATDAAKIKAMMGSEDMKKTMAEAGVKGEPTIWMANDAEVWFGGGTGSLIVKHKVKDYDAWKKVYDSVDEARKSSGVVWASVGRMLDDDTVVVVHHIGSDMAKLTAFASSPELKEAMKKAGVEGEPTIWMANDVEIKSPEKPVEGDVWDVYVKHDVADFDVWKTKFDEHAKVRADAGFIAGSVHRHADNPNTVIVHAMTADLGKSKAFFESDDLKKIMKEAGVTGPPEIWMAKSVEVTSAKKTM
jgi:quinol monooxygenase YgiN